MAKRRDFWDDVVLDESFVADAPVREGSADERVAGARAARMAARRSVRQSVRSQRRQQRRARLARHKAALVVVGFLALAVGWSRLDGPIRPSVAAGTPAKVRVVYAVPSDTATSDTMIGAVRHELDIVQHWFESQTGGRHLRLGSDQGEVAVEVRHLTVTAAELRDRPDAFSLVDDELRPPSSGLRGPYEILLSFVPVTFAEQVRCGEGSQAGFAVVWVGSCGQIPSTDSVAFGDGATFTVAHELVHALGAVAPCAPHYGRNGHVTDDPRDLLYDGPLADPPGAAVLLDPGHDDYYRTGHPDCVDIAAAPAWTK